MKKTWNQALALLLAALCALSLGSQPAAAVQQQGDAITDGREVSQLVQDYWEEDYFQQVVIDPEGKQVTADGVQTTLEASLELEPSEATQVMQSAQAAEDYFQDSPYEAEQTRKGTVVVTAPYQTKRLVVSTRTLTRTYGAEEVLHNGQMGQYVLQYATQAEAQAAYEQLSEEYGADRCFVDEVMDVDTLLESEGDGTACDSWGAAYMGMDELKAAVEVDEMAAAVTVAVIDTGVDAAHAYFAGGRIAADSASFASDGGGLADTTGHGTHVAGIVADCTPDNVKLLILRIFNRNGKSSAALMAAAIQYAVQHQASVINISSGWADGKASASVRGILDPAIGEAYEAGIPVINAAGNDQQDVSLCYPACSSQTIAVSSINSEGYFDSWNSNFGAGIDFAAPGVNVVSAQRGGGTCSKTGTSMAAPHLAAAAAYVKLFHPEADVSQVYDQLKQYAVDVGEPGKDSKYGWGYVDLTGYDIDAKGESRSCEAWEIILSADSYPYDGTPKKPAVTVLEKGRRIPSRYYQVRYQNNNAVGKATVVVTGQGVYRGTVQKSFSITLSTPKLGSIANGAEGVVLKWQAVPGAAGYLVERKQGNGKWMQVKRISKGTTTSWTDGKVSNGVAYQYRLRGVSGKVTSACSTAKSITCLTRPKLSSVKNSGKQAVTVTWQKNAKASGYQVQYGQDSRFENGKIVTVSSGKKVKTVIKKLKKKGSYRIRVRACRTVSGRKVYSAWSMARAVIVKK